MIPGIIARICSTRIFDFLVSSALATERSINSGNAKIYGIVISISDLQLVNLGYGIGGVR